MISDRQFTFFPGLAITRGSEGALVFGPIIKYSNTSATEDDTVLNEEQPLGVGKFGQVGFQAEARHDSRKIPKHLCQGHRFQAQRGLLRRSMGREERLWVGGKASLAPTSL